MLRELHIRGLGVIDDAEVRFAPGLNVVTGETGVGKTLLITSLALLTGARATAKLVKHDADEAVLDAIVEPPGHAPVLAELGIEPSDELVITRRIGSDGRSKAWIDGRLVPLSVLTEVGAGLLEIHGQGSGFALATPARQREALDAVGGHGDLVARYAETYGTVRDLRDRLAAIEAQDATRDREIDLLRHQVDEVGRAELTPDEDERLAGDIARLEHAETLSGVADAVVALAGPDGAAGDLTEAHKALDDAVRIDGDLAPLAARLGELAAETAETARDLRRWAETLEGDPADLEAMRERRALIATLRRKYGGSLADVIAAADAAADRLAELEGAGSEASLLREQLATASERLDDLAAELSSRRRAAADDLTAMVASELPALALPKAVFSVRVEDAPPGPSGADDVTFLFSADAGRPAEPLGSVASGGELSRSMIAVTLALARAHAVPALVFDEADAGVGGEAALEVAKRLARLGRTHQVLVVSHLPQIAAFADHHLTVGKRGDAVVVQVLDESERLPEISRMLAGLGSSHLAQAHAAELIELAGAERTPAKTA